MTEDHSEYLEYKREIMEMDEKNAAKLEENVLILFDSGVFKTRIAEMMLISREEVCEIIDGRR